MEILKIDDLKPNSSLNKTENWDSLNHLIIMSRLENEFNVKFTAKDIEQLISFENIYNKLKELLGNE
ncbi:MAG: acyl carrier protein [Flavobacteriaceae bacterium]|nr:acyl carrier protein [Flavobacteriaceae bacterium]MBT6169123.1 acyl carrier protein [Flavobacteriaceae bacterium]MBT6447797.1 acyl carrier protein [Flavobacteriaceae bacterium]